MLNLYDPFIVVLLSFRHACETSVPLTVYILLIQFPKICCSQGGKKIKDFFVVKRESISRSRLKLNCMAHGLS